MELAAALHVFGSKLVSGTWTGRELDPLRALAPAPQKQRIFAGITLAPLRLAAN